MKREVTIVYTIEDEESFQRAGNPLRFEHHGLKAHTIAVGDSVTARNSLLEALQDLDGVSFGYVKEVATKAIDAEQARITAALK